jgi:GT2 family glycosyltransferase
LTPQQNPEGEKRPLRASVVVVSHNRKPLLETCLASLEKSEGREDLQIVVVDNGSRDGAAGLDAEFARVQWIRLPKNFGLTKAMNLGWRAADAELVLFLHDDTEVEPGAVLRLAEALEANPDVAAVCPLLVDEDGHPAPQLGKLPPDGEWRPAAPSGSHPMAVEYPRGAALMTRVALIRAVRQIDERFGQFGADADLAANFRRASKKVLLLPDVKVRHRSAAGYSPEEIADFLLARAAYLGKYQGFGAGLLARLGAIFGPLVRFRFGEFKNTLAGQKIDGTQM